MKIANMAGTYFNEYFADEIVSGETVSILEFIGDNSTVPKQRTEGFMEVAGDNVNIVERFDTQWRRDIACEQMKDWLVTASISEIESVQAIYSHEDETVLGLMDAIADYGGPAKLNIRLIIGIGGKRDLIIHTGYYKENFNIDLVTYSFSPAMIREAIGEGAKVTAGETIENENLIGTVEITHSTLARYLASETYQTRYTTALPAFDDVLENDWYSAAVSSIAIEGYMGTDKSFNPDATVTADEARELLAAVLPYTMASIRGNEPLTREKLAVMLTEALTGYRLIEIRDILSYTDAEQISGDYKNEVDFVYKTGLMHSVSGERFEPKGIITRAQMATVIADVMNACLTAESVGE